MSNRRRRTRRNPPRWQRVAGSKTTADTVNLVSTAFLGYVGYKIYQWLTAPKTSP